MTFRFCGYEISVSVIGSLCAFSYLTDTDNEVLHLLNKEWV